MIGVGVSPSVQILADDHDHSSDPCDHDRSNAPARGHEAVDEECNAEQDHSRMAHVRNYPRRAASGKVLGDGRIETQGVAYDSPATTASAIKGGAANGWEFWAVEDALGKTTLGTLRARLPETTRARQSSLLSLRTSAHTRTDRTVMHMINSARTLDLVALRAVYQPLREVRDQAVQLVGAGLVAGSSAPGSQELVAHLANEADRSDLSDQPLSSVVDELGYSRSREWINNTTCALINSCSVVPTGEFLKRFGGEGEE